MTASKIEWTERSDWNAIRGCTRVSPGCGGPGPHGGCYAEAIAARFSDPGQAFHGFAERTKSGPRWTGKVEVQWDRLDLPLTWRAPATIFASSTSDWFHEALPVDEIANLYAVAVAAVHLRGHTIQILTKRSGRCREILNSEAFWEQVNAEAGAYVMERTDPYARRSDDARATFRDDYGPINPPPGIWVGVSVEDQERADERLFDLSCTPAAIRFASFEPLLGPVDPTRVRVNSNLAWNALTCDLYSTITNEIIAGPPSGHGPLDLIIIGGESGPRARDFDIAWARSLIAQCRASGTACFLKQLGAQPIDGAEGGRRLRLTDRKGGNWNEWSSDLCVREMPT